MSDDRYSNYSTTNIVEIDDTNYLVQGQIDDPITMFRSINDLLECERDNVQKMLGDKQK